MSQYMSHGGFNWFEATFDDVTDTSEVCLVYEINISYPINLHDRHINLPFLSNNTKSTCSKIQKLIATAEAKTHNIIIPS